MNKPVLGLLVGGILGVFDGLSALVSAPEIKAEIMSIVLGSTFKGVLAGVIIGFFARKVRNVTSGVLFGLAVGLLLAGLVAMVATPNPETGTPYWVEIMLPGSIVGAIVGYATQRWGNAPGGTPARA